MEGYIGIVRCSFCEKTADQVKKIFYGSKGSCICNECIHACVDIMDQELNADLSKELILNNGKPIEDKLIRKNLPYLKEVIDKLVYRDFGKVLPQYDMRIVRFANSSVYSFRIFRDVYDFTDEFLDSCSAQCWSVELNVAEIHTRPGKRFFYINNVKKQKRDFCVNISCITKSTCRDYEIPKFREREGKYRYCVKQVYGDEYKKFYGDYQKEEFCVKSSYEEVMKDIKKKKIIYALVDGTEIPLDHIGEVGPYIVTRYGMYYEKDDNIFYRDCKGEQKKVYSMGGEQSYIAVKSLHISGDQLIVTYISKIRQNESMAKHWGRPGWYSQEELDELGEKGLLNNRPCYNYYGYYDGYEMETMELAIGLPRETI